MPATRLRPYLDWTGPSTSILASYWKAEKLDLLISEIH